MSVIITTVVLSLKKRMSRRDYGDSGVSGFGNAGVSWEEIRDSFTKLEVRGDLLRQRAKLEQNMLEMTTKLPWFLISQFCFVFALTVFFPPGAIADAHAAIKRHFHLPTATRVETLDDLLDYVQTFSLANDEMQATSYKYWCSDRYINQHWDDRLLIPTRSCPSPRLYALGHAGASWSSLHGAPPGSRHLKAAAPNNVLPCADDDSALALAEQNPTATCNNTAHHTCNIYIGALYCQKTCGYCAPYSYHHFKDFTKPQVTLLPVMLYQTRFKAKPCEGFAHTYETQPFNRLLFMAPALDGPRHGRVMTCVDRTKHQDADYGFEIPCPPNITTSECREGVVRHSKRFKFDGHNVYVQPMMRIRENLEVMKEIGWLDSQSEEIVASSMVYTAGDEIFTSVALHFQISKAGTIKGSFKLMSYKDITPNYKYTFIICMVVSSIISLVGASLSIWQMMGNRSSGNVGLQAFETLSRLAMAIYVPVLLVTWSQQIPMSKEFDHIMHQFLDMQSLSGEDIDSAIQDFFNTKTHVYHELQWLASHRCTAYLILYAQFLQLIFYFNAHPKMALLTSTVWDAMGNLVHFFILFFLFYGALGFMGFWMLGDSLNGFETFGSSLTIELQMLCGEFIKHPHTDSLNGTQLFMYWFWACTFLFVMVFLLLNFFLAIVVDSFVAVKEINSKQTTANSFFYDLLVIPYMRIMAYFNKWPTPGMLLEFLAAMHTESLVRKSSHLAHWTETLPKSDADEQDEDDGQKFFFEPEALMEYFPEVSQDAVAKMLAHMFRSNPKILSLRSSNPGAV